MPSSFRVHPERDVSSVGHLTRTKDMEGLSAFLNHPNLHLHLIKVKSVRVCLTPCSIIPYKSWTHYHRTWRLHFSPVTNYIWKLVTLSEIGDSAILRSPTLVWGTPTNTTEACFRWRDQHVPWRVEAQSSSFAWRLRMHVTVEDV